MLQSLTVENIVLIDRLHLDFEEDFSVLTGETGAGKSILLDALGLAVGARAEARLLRQGAKKAQVTACFSLPSTHSLWKTLAEQGIDGDQETLIFRRILESDGKSKCFLNDQLITQTLMRQLGAELVEVHGQFDRLLDAKEHLRALDTYGKINSAEVKEVFGSYQKAKKSLLEFRESLAKAAERKVYLQLAVEEIEKAAPKPGEEQELEEEKAFIGHRAKIADALEVAGQAIGSGISELSQAHKALDRIQSLVPEKANEWCEACDRALLEAQEVSDSLRQARRDVEGSSLDLETIENRLYALRALSRKYISEDLCKTLEDFSQELQGLEEGDDRLLALEGEVEAAKSAYLSRASTLSLERREVAQKLERALAKEFQPLKLNHAVFRVHFLDLPEERWNEKGIDGVEFYIQTNPGSPEGPLSAIASGGELSRFMLALKAILAQARVIPTLIFDEIESGTGGAVASAIGERLAALSHSTQVLAITHAPQIAAYGKQHLVVYKVVENNETKTLVTGLNDNERQEEVARMLAGEQITDEARAAAQRLIGGS